MPLPYHANIYLSKEQIEMLLRLDIPDPEMVLRLQYHLSKYAQEEWPTIRVRFQLRSNRRAEMIRWCLDKFGDKNIIDRRWTIVDDYSTGLYRHTKLSFRFPADEIMFKMFWQDHIWAAPRPPMKID